MRPLLHTLPLAAALLFGCGSAGSTATATPTGTEPQTTQTQASPSTPTPPALPAATACHLDSDCTVAVSAPDTSALCCDVTVTAQPLANAYLQAVAEWRRGACANANCAPGALPGAQLAPCGYEARCVESACTNACNQPERPSQPQITAPPS